jgi:hypothetical protein
MKIGSMLLCFSHPIQAFNSVQRFCVIRSYPITESIQVASVAAHHLLSDFHTTHYTEKVPSDTKRRAKTDLNTYAADPDNMMQDGSALAPYDCDAEPPSKRMKG